MISVYIYVVLRSSLFLFFYVLFLGLLLCNSEIKYFHLHETAVFGWFMSRFCGSLHLLLFTIWFDRNKVKVSLRFRSEHFLLKFCSEFLKCLSVIATALPSWF